MLLVFTNQFLSPLVDSLTADAVSFHLDMFSLSHCRHDVFILIEHIAIHAYMYNTGVPFGCVAHGEHSETPVRVGFGCSMGCV